MARLVAHERAARVAAEGEVARAGLLQAVMVGLVEALTPDEVARVIIEQGVAAAGAVAGIIALLDETGTELEVIRATGHDTNPVWHWSRQPLTAPGPAPEAVRLGEPIWLDSRTELGERYSNLLPSVPPDIEAVAALPLRARGRVLGALRLSFTEPGRLTPGWRAFLLALASQCALALERAELLRSEMAARRQATFLAEASRILTASLDYQACLTDLTRLVVPTLADWCVVDLLQTDGLIHRLAITHADPVGQAAADELLRRYPRLPLDARHTITRVLRERRPWFDPAVDEGRFITEARDPSHLDLLRRLGFASEMVVPLVARGRALGTITLAFGAASGRRHTPDDLALAEDLAARAALALDNARLHGAEAAARARAEALAGATRALVEAGAAPDTVLPEVARQASTLVGDLTVVRLLSADGCWLETAAFDHLDPAKRAEAESALLGQRHPTDQGASGAALQTGRPQRLAGAAVEELRWASDPHLWSPMPGVPTRALLAVPLRASGRVIGTLSVSRGEADRPYTEDDERFLQELADRAALAIERARLYAAESRARERATFLAEAGHRLAESLDPAATLTVIADLLVPVLADWCIVDLIGDDGRVERSVVSHANPAGATLAAGLRRHPPDLARPDRGADALRTGRPEFEAAVTDETLVKIARDEDHLALLRALGPVSHLRVPLVAHGRVLGSLLLVATESGRRYGTDDLALAEELAGRAALALDNARLHAATAASEERFRTSVESLLDCFGIYSAVRDEAGQIVDFRIDYVNTAASSSIGVPASELVGRAIGEVLPAHRDNGLLNTYRSVVETGEPFARDGVHIEDVYAGERRQKVLDIRASRLGDGLVAAWRDVTVRARIAQERERLLVDLMAAEARYHGLFEGVADAIVVTDAAGRVVEVNAATAILLGYTVDELLGRQIVDLIEDRTWGHQAFAQLVHDDFWQGEVELRASDGTTIPVEKTIRRVNLPTGPVFLGVNRDIRHRRELERMQQEFLSLVTHELKNPLTGLSGYAQLMRRREVYDAGAVAAIARETKRLERLINDLLDVTRAEAGQLSLQPARIDLVSTTRAIVESAQTQTTAHAIKVVAPANPVVGFWDPDRLEQVLQNLLLNAIKYSPNSGPIRVTIDPRAREVAVTVADQGLGLAPEARSRLFGRFYRTDEATELRLPGLGLGLYIARRLVEAHGGRIWAESDGLGHGSTFGFTLPYRAGAVGD